jgi:hypothetical protein
MSSTTMEPVETRQVWRKMDRGGKDREGPLEEFEGDPRGRLAKAVRAQETIVVCGGVGDRPADASPLRR